MKYSKEFKEEALKLSDEIGVKKAAQQLGIQYYTLSDWRSKRSAAIRHQKDQISDEELDRTDFVVCGMLYPAQKRRSIPHDTIR